MMRYDVNTLALVLWDGEVTLTAGAFTIGVVDQGVAGASPWLVTSTTLATAARQDTGNTSLTSIDGKTPALGQQLAAASSPVVLTAAQVSTLTPPAAIVGFALDASISTLNTSVNTLLKPASTLAAVTAITNPVDTLANLSVPKHDYLSLSYTGANLTGVVYKTGGAVGTTVATLTLAYSGAVLTSVTKT